MCYVLTVANTEEMDNRKIADQEWTSNQPANTSSPIRMPATPPSATLLGSGSQTNSSSYNRSGQYSSQHQQQQQNTPHPPMSPHHHQRNLPPIPIQPYTTPPSRQPGASLPPIHTHPQHHLTTPQYHIPPPNAPPTPGETPWDLRQTEVYRLDDHTCRLKLIDAIQHIQHLSSTLASARTSLAQYTLQNTLLRSESREISQRSAVETELAKREVEVLLREYAAQMPSANQLANTYYRRYRGLKRRVKDLETIIEDRDAELKRLKEYVRDNGITMPREGAKRTRRTGLKYAPRGGAWAVAGKTKPPVVPRTLKPAPSSQQINSEANSQESQASSGLDALGMLASQVLDSQESQHPSTQKQKYYPSSTQITSTPYNLPSSPLTTRTSSSHPPHHQPTLLSPLPIPTSKRRRTTSRASDSTIEPDPALTESEVSPTKIRVLDDTDEDDEEEERVRESPVPASQGNPYASSLPIPYRTTRSVARELVPGVGGPRRKLNFDSKDSELLNHD